MTDKPTGGAQSRSGTIRDVYSKHRRNGATRRKAAAAALAIGEPSGISASDAEFTATSSSVQERVERFWDRVHQKQFRICLRLLAGIERNLGDGDENDR